MKVEGGGGAESGIGPDFCLRYLRNLGLIHYVGDRRAIRRRGEIGSSAVYNVRWIQGPMYALTNHNRISEDNCMGPQSYFLDLLAQAQRSCVSRRPEYWQTQPWEGQTGEHVFQLARACHLLYEAGSAGDLHYIVVDRIRRTEDPPSEDQLKTAHVAEFFPFMPEPLQLRLAGVLFEHLIGPIEGLSRNRIIIRARSGGAGTGSENERQERVTVWTPGSRMYSWADEPSSAMTHLEAVIAEQIRALAERNELGCTILPATRLLTAGKR